VNHAVSVSDLTVRLGGQEVLSGVSMSVQKGWIAGIMGPNGGGKTTLLRVLLGMITPESGEVEVLGMSPKHAARTGLVGYLPQRSVQSLLPVTALEVVRMGNHATRREALEALELMGVADLAKRSFWRLSGGQAQRVSLARVVVSNPGLALLDEPSTGIDTVSQEDFYRLLLRLREERGITVLLTSHDVGAISSYVDQVFCLNVRMHCHGPASRCLTRERLSELYGRDVDFIYHPPEDADGHT